MLRFAKTKFELFVTKQQLKLVQIRIPSLKIERLPALSLCRIVFGNVFLDENAYGSNTTSRVKNVNSDASTDYKDAVGVSSVPVVFAGGGGAVGYANETQGDNAIETAINSSVPAAGKYKTQQVYVVNSSNVQKQGTIDYLVIQNSPQKRWLLNYITTGESLLNTTNLSGTVYVLEITNKTTAEIVNEVSTFINSTKN